MRIGLVALLAILLSGCAGWGVSGRDDGEHWALSGKLGIRQAGQAESALLNWSLCGERYRLILSGPLGQQLARVEGGPRGATFWLRDAAPEHTSDAQAWLDQRLGWPLPIQQLQYWVRGMAAPERTAGGAILQRDDSGRIAALEQGPWRVEYLEFHDAGQAALPRRMRASRGDLTATLVIRQWQLGPEVQTCPTP